MLLVALAVTGVFTLGCAFATSVAMLAALRFVGFPMGAVVGGALATVLMMRLGWPAVFLLGGTFALLMLIPVLAVIPARAHAPAARRGALTPLVDVFAQGRAASTLALRLGVLSSMILSGFLVSFVPTILNMNGVPPHGRH